MPPLPPALEALAREAAATFTRFPRALFEDLARRYLVPLGAALEGAPDRDAVLASYARLLAEAAGRRYVRAVPGEDAAPESVLEHLLLRVAPRDLARVAPGRRVARLAEAWNLGEGLRTQPAWLRRTLLRTSHALASLDTLAGDLATLVDDLGKEGPPASWEGPFRVALLDPREHDPDFLPGNLHFPKPSVVCVHDRHDTRRKLGVALLRGGRSTLVDRPPCGGEDAQFEPGPFPVFEVDGVRLGEATVPLPNFGHWFRFATTASGFLLASAVSSQRLWVVESA